MNCPYIRPFTQFSHSCIIAAVKRILSFYIIREISSLFLLGLVIFTMVLLMGRLIKLTELVVTRGVPLADVCKMILYLIPSFLIYTIPMAFLLAVLLAFGRLSADNEIVVIKASGISLYQVMPPVIFCAVVAVLLAFGVSAIGAPWGNSSFRELSLRVLTNNITATIREKTFWDDIPGVVMYTDHYEEKSKQLKGVVIHDGRNTSRPMTIFARDGVISGTSGSNALRLSLQDGSIHMAGEDGLYRLVYFGEYSMTVGGTESSTPLPRNESDIWLSDLIRQMNDPAIPANIRRKHRTEFHSRFTFPCASFVFAILAVPLGIQNRRSGKSGGFAVSILIILAYYVMMSVAKTFPEKGLLPGSIALWLPNLVFIAIGLYFLRLASLEKSLPRLQLKTVLEFFRRSA
ncbi:MAG: LPS export ABC transporter permease LptF [Desulfuromonadaceae bacterium]|nr:LPS export ABC transporter permease LptF [Desulfuromonadaceae bacterium]